MARARVELSEGLSCAVRGKVYKRGVAVYEDNPVTIQYLKNQSNFHVVELPDPVKALPPKPAAPVSEKTVVLTPPVNKIDAKVKLDEPKEETPKAQAEPEPLERTPVKPVPRTLKGARGRRSSV